MLLEVEQDLLKELSIFYDKIKFNFQLEYASFLSEDKKNNLFHINFDKQFFYPLQYHYTFSKNQYTYIIF